MLTCSTCLSVIVYVNNCNRIITAVVLYVILEDRKGFEKDSCLDSSLRVTTASFLFNVDLLCFSS